jgi:flagellar export protein FliJ
MAGFRFKFQPILDIRQQIEDVRKFEMAKAISFCEEEKERLSEFKRTENRCIQDICEEVSGGMDLLRIKECNSYLLHMRKLIDNQEHAVNEAQLKVEESRDRLKTALIEKKTMENLREKHVREYAKEQIKLEQKVTDEITSYKYKVKSGD